MVSMFDRPRIQVLKFEERFPKEPKQKSFSAREIGITLSWVELRVLISRFERAILEAQGKLLKLLHEFFKLLL